MKARTKAGEPWFFMRLTRKEDEAITRANDFIGDVKLFHFDMVARLAWGAVNNHKSLREIRAYLLDKICGMDIEVSLTEDREIQKVFVFFHIAPMPYDFSVQVLLPWIVAWNKRYKRTHRNMPFILNFQKCTTIVVPLTKKGN